MTSYISKNFYHPKIDQQRYVVVLKYSSETPIFTETVSKNTRFPYVEVINTLHEVKATDDSSKIVDKLELLTNHKDILELSKEFFSSKEKLVNRLSHLINLYDEEDSEISIDSLKSMFIFLISIAVDFSIPSITLNENGTFQINWRKDNFNLITLRFGSNNFVDYLIVEPSRHTEKPIILNGQMNLFDFIEHIKKLNLMHLIRR